MREPARLSGLLGKAAEGMGVKDPLAVARVFSAWAEIVGPEIATRCQPSALKGGVLKVSIPSQAWAAQFRFVAPEIIRRLNDHLGAEVVTEIKAWVPTPTKAAKRDAETPRDAPPKPVPKPLPAPTEQDELEAAEVAANIADEALAESLKRALLAGKMRQRRG